MGGGVFLLSISDTALQKQVGFYSSADKTETCGGESVLVVAACFTDVPPN